MEFKLWLRAVFLLVSLTVFCPIAVADISTGRSAPACDREARELKYLVSRLEAGYLLGSPIDMTLTDPLWAGGEWIKFKHVTIQRELVGGGYARRYVIDIHYMWNSRTGQVADIKFKNNVDVGCQGRVDLAEAWEVYAGSNSSSAENGTTFDVIINGYWIYPEVSSPGPVPAPPTMSGGDLTANQWYFVITSIEFVIRGSTLYREN